jgi:excinuclease UvrABC ATPase subunit
MTKRDNIQVQIDRLDKQMATLQQIRDSLVSQLSRPNGMPTEVTSVPNNCFVEEWRMCDVCYVDFNWGDEETHYYFDDDSKDVCPSCVESNKKN